MSEKNSISSSEPRIENSSVVVIGLTGSLGSGCSYIRGGIKENFPETCYYYNLSDILHEILEKNGTPRNKQTIAQLQDLGNELREKYGNSVLVEEVMGKLSEKEQKCGLDEKAIVIVDGIRNEGEIRALQTMPNFYLISVHADKNVRQKRLVGQNAKKQRFITEEEFAKADQRDVDEEIENGQQVKKCNYLSDIIINNDKDFADNSDGETKFFQEIITNYINPIIIISKGEKLPPDHPPKISETLMTIAYCASKRSSCTKRKVGSVIAHIVEFRKLEGKVKRPEDHIKFQVVSSGFNEVPLGTTPCALDDDVTNSRCQRDYLKKTFSKEFKYCPNCGGKIPKDADLSYQCSNCETLIFEQYLPGTRKGSGKLLDICRSLHGEENAIIGLAGVNKNVYNYGSNDDINSRLVLFTTTFPCNLCANKIVEAGISEVWYAEPYAMEEAKKILSEANIKTYKFEGVKSKAYFRLYS